ncbi:hypothetical protein ALC60_12530 [Trachymyrmex zeteki]|uniref:Uncharacterized protein n=1 Tax=Mycetomoellerius zeteki TaxID=64791 RepID=A0A151WKU6_9HYME|nr:hypothetical protein ALC60_12530 [Trachymyrmex zeteki]
MPSRNAASREVCTSLAMLNARRTPRQRKYHEIKAQLPSNLIAPVATPISFVYFALSTYTKNHSLSGCITSLFDVDCVIEDSLFHYKSVTFILSRCSVSRNHGNDRTSSSLFGISLLYAYKLHRQASVTIIIGSTKRHWPNWRRLAERFAFGMVAQLRAATRDFPVHDRLHASQTPKGCSFTGLPPLAGMGSPYRMDDGWTAGDSDAATTAGGVRPGTMVEG